MTAQVVAPSMAPYRSWTHPLLVLTTQKTAEADPEQLQMHKEIAEAHRAGGATAEAMVLQGAGHDLLMTNSTYATRIGALMMGFVRVQEKDSIRHGQWCRSGDRSRFFRHHSSARSPLDGRLRGRRHPRHRPCGVSRRLPGRPGKDHQTRFRRET